MAEMLKNELGMVPVNLFTDSSTSYSWLMLPNASGMEPPKLLPADQAGLVQSATGC